MAAAGGDLGVSFLVVATLAHEFSTVLFVEVLAYELVHKVLDLIASSELIKAFDVVQAFGTLQIEDELSLYLTDGLLLLGLLGLDRLHQSLLCLWKHCKFFMSFWQTCLLNYVIW